MSSDFSLYLFTDPHYYDNDGMDTESEEFLDYIKGSPRCVVESGALLDSCIGEINADDSADTVLIAGDLTHWGERVCHDGFKKKLKMLTDNGKKVFLITATHDYGRSFRGETARDELSSFYWDYGFSSAISTYDRDGLSYTVQLTDGIRLLALNSDGNTREFRGFWDDQLLWAKEQIEDAHKTGNYIFAMTHYPLLPGSPVMGLVKDAVLSDWEKSACFLADAGLDLILTGHMHMQSLNTYTTPAGNTITDICTGALCACPPAFRKITFLSDGRVDVKTRIVENIDWDLGGKTPREYSEGKFAGLIDRKLAQMKTDYRGFMGYIGSSSPNPKLEKPVNFAGKAIEKLTIGKLSHIFLFRADGSVKNVLFKDLLLNCVINVFEGDEPYIKGTPEYEVFRKLLKRLKLPVSILQKKLGKKNKQLSDLPGFVYSLIGDEKMLDNNAVLGLQWNKYKKED